MREADSTSIANSFVGRERELAELRHTLDEARDGRGRVFLVSGGIAAAQTEIRLLERHHLSFFRAA